MIAEILNVGSEILIGDILNTNAKYLSLKLSEFGLDVYCHTSVGDNVKRIKEAIKRALERCDILFITGGLGPTKDDITKEAVADFFLKNLVEDLEIKKSIEEKFNLTKTKITNNNYKQCLVIEDAKVFKNNKGTAPALLVEHKRKKIFLLPGPPEEVKEIFENEISPYLENLSGFLIASKNVNVYGLTESCVDELVADFLEYENPTVGIYAKGGEVRLRITAKAKTEEECDVLIKNVFLKIKNRIGKFVYGFNTNMQAALVEAFKLKEKTLAVAESCTGGLISSKIVEVSGSSEIFKLGAVCYSNYAKTKILNVREESLNKFGAVSAIVAKEMAYGARKVSNADIAISTTGIAGPNGGTKEKPVGLVYVGISTEKETKAFKLFLSKNEKDERNTIRNLAAMFAMNKAREEVLKS